ncbi:uncharacterized protein ARMOST_15516 [Armillaria ostoyae]|uniref:Retrotransposon gag domain-containing protein n=1 Tax=Armillaria ostoyae TaxID=47428 RepID=A0A284RTP7_ARMOS|nr:uncharacterized protein ARMOST_15516 [Armillaria ostoyae]
MSPSSPKTPSSHQSSLYPRKLTKAQSILLLVRRSFKGTLRRKASTSSLLNIPETLQRVSMPSPLWEALSQADKGWADSLETLMGPILPPFQLEALRLNPLQMPTLTMKTSSITLSKGEAIIANLGDLRSPSLLLGLGEPANAAAPDSNYAPPPLDPTERLAYGEEYSQTWDEHRESQILYRSCNIPLAEHQQEYWRNACDGSGDPASIGSRIHENLLQSLYGPYLGPDLKDVKDGAPMEGLRSFRNDLEYLPHAADDDAWSLPMGPPKWNPKTQLPNPSSTMADDAPWTGCRPKLIRKPKVFKETPRISSGSSPHAKCTFKALDWWTLELDEMESNSQGKYQLPAWEDFVEMIQKKFRDAVVEEVHKKRMYDLHMGSSTTQEYFQDLEKHL